MIVSKSVRYFLASKMGDIRDREGRFYSLNDDGKGTREMRFVSAETGETLTVLQISGSLIIDVEGNLYIGRPTGDSEMKCFIVPSPDRVVRFFRFVEDRPKFIDADQVQYFLEEEDQLFHSTMVRNGKVLVRSTPFLLQDASGKIWILREYSIGPSDTSLTFFKYWPVEIEMNLKNFSTSTRSDVVHSFSNKSIYLTTNSVGQLVFLKCERSVEILDGNPNIVLESQICDRFHEKIVRFIPIGLVDQKGGVYVVLPAGTKQDLWFDNIDEFPRVEVATFYDKVFDIVSITTLFNVKTVASGNLNTIFNILQKDGQMTIIDSNSKKFVVWPDVLDLVVFYDLLYVYDFQGNLTVYKENSIDPKFKFSMRGSLVPHFEDIV